MSARGGSVDCARRRSGEPQRVRECQGDRLTRIVVVERELGDLVQEDGVLALRDLHAYLSQIRSPDGEAAIDVG